ncbi:MAG: TraR/DksA family transcriptional regulator [Pseudohongiellaceae bacterium]
METKQLEQIKKDLTSRKAELESRLERTHKHIFHKDAPVSANFSEQIKETENDQLVMALEADAIEELKQISRALQRIADDEYLECARCGNDIGAERLAAIPYTDRCIKCAE